MIQVDNDRRADPRPDADFRRRGRRRAVFPPRRASSGACSRRSASRSPALESHLGVTLFDRSGKTPRLTPAGEALIKDARRLLERADELKARAASIASDVEPELSLAVDPIFPHEPLMASLKALSAAFPKLPVTIFTENLGGSEQRLRDGVAQFAIAPMRLERRGRPRRRIPRRLRRRAGRLPRIIRWRASRSRSRARRSSPMSSSSSPTARRSPTISAAASSAITSGASPISRPASNSCSPASAGATCRCTWCASTIAAGRLKALALAERDPFQFRVHVMRMRGREIGRAGRWLIDDLRLLTAPAPRPIARPAPPAAG